MKIQINILTILTIGFLFSSCNKEIIIDKKDWKLTFSDEFNDSVLSVAKWDLKGLPWGQAYESEEQHYYTKSALKVRNGILHIEANRDTIDGDVYDKDFKLKNKRFYFSSGMIQSSRTFAQQFGYFETRAKVPNSPGFWPAFWLYGYSTMPHEIDVFEIFTSKVKSLRMTNHYRNKDGEKRMSAFTYQGPDFSKDFHVFGVEWNPKEIIWYLDGKKVFSSEAGVSNEQLFIILSMGVGEGSLLANDKTLFPSALEIDYVRVYKKKQN